MTDFPITIVARILAAVCILKTMCAVTFAVVQVVIMFVLVAMRESYMADKQFTLEEITASWLGTGKKIPIGQMMAWLIKEVERLSSLIPFSDPISGQIAELNRENDYLSEQAAKLDELEHKVAETAYKCDVPHDNDLEATETLDRIAEFYADCRAAVEEIAPVLCAYTCPSGVSPKVHTERCKRVSAALDGDRRLSARDHDENCDIYDAMVPGKPCNCYIKFKLEIAPLKEQISALEQENTKLRRFLDRHQGYLLDAVNALEAMPVSDDNFQNQEPWSLWEKYQRWAEGLRKQTVERIRRELSI